MALFGNKPKTAHQKAQRAKTRIMLRAIALLYVIFYIIIPMIDNRTEEFEAVHPAFRYGVLAFFIIVCVYLSVTTILEYIRNNKAGLYKAEAYTDDEEEADGNKD